MVSFTDIIVTDRKKRSHERKKLQAMKKNRTILFLMIFAVCIFCFASCGRTGTTGSVPGGTGTGSGSVSGNASNDTINSNRGNADGGRADYNRNGGIIDGAAGDIVDGARNVMDDVTNGVKNGIDNMTGNNGTNSGNSRTTNGVKDNAMNNTAGSYGSADSNFGTDSMNSGGNTTANY